MIGLFGGAFDPPHNGHLALLRTAKQALGLSSAVVVVAAHPGHKTVDTPAATRLELTRAAFPGERVVLDEHARTIDTIRAHPEWVGAVFLLGADEFADFLDWTEPLELLGLVRLGVATRPGTSPERLSGVLDRLDHPDRVLFFDLEPVPIASRELRRALDRGDDVHDLVPPAVWKKIEEDRLYGRSRGYTGPA